MSYGILDETKEERKYPRWFRYLAIIYVVILFWTMFSLPPAGYDWDISFIIFLMWFPIILGVLYYFEKPGFIGNHKKAWRILFAIFTFIAMFWGIVFSYMFFE